MPKRKHTDLHHDVELIMEVLIYRFPEDRKYTTLAELRQATGLTSREVSNAVRALVAVWGVLEYTAPGEYRILNLEAYFEPLRPGAFERWRRKYLR